MRVGSSYNWSLVIPVVLVAATLVLLLSVAGIIPSPRDVWDGLVAIMSSIPGWGTIRSLF
jgi:hypothetical protein